MVHRESPDPDTNGNPTQEPVVIGWCCAETMETAPVHCPRRQAAAPVPSRLSYTIKETRKPFFSVTWILLFQDAHVAPCLPTVAV